LGLKIKWIDFLYKVATGSKKIRTLLTPVGATFFALFLAVLIVVATQVDKLLKLPTLLARPLNFVFSLPVLIAGLLIMGWSVLTFLRMRGTPVPFNPPPKLVTSGPYAYMRNPMLTGVFMMFFGLGILIQSVSVVFIFTPLFIAFNVWELKAIEEPELEKRLGTEYLEYKKGTSMFMPDLTIIFGKKKK
jgi:protein-S-isoprenylcysteine O-methyltransferase Ste14